MLHFINLLIYYITPNDLVGIIFWETFITFAKILNVIFHYCFLLLYYYPGHDIMPEDNYTFGHFTPLQYIIPQWYYLTDENLLSIPWISRPGIMFMLILLILKCCAFLLLWDIIFIIFWFCFFFIMAFLNIIVRLFIYYIFYYKSTWYIQFSNDILELQYQADVKERFLWIQKYNPHVNLLVPPHERLGAKSIRFAFFKLRYTSPYFWGLLLVAYSFFYLIFEWYHILYHFDPEAVVRCMERLDMNLGRVNKSITETVGNHLTFEAMSEYNKKRFLEYKLSVYLHTIWWWLVGFIVFLTISFWPRGLLVWRKYQEVWVAVMIFLLSMPITETMWAANMWLSYWDILGLEEYPFYLWIMYLGLTSAGSDLNDPQEDLDMYEEQLASERTSIREEDVDEAKTFLQWDVADENPILDIHTHLSTEMGIFDYEDILEEMRGDMVSRHDYDLQKTEQIEEEIFNYLSGIQDRKMDHFRYYLMGLIYYYWWKKPSLLIKFSINYHIKKIKFAWWLIKNT